MVIELIKVKTVTKRDGRTVEFDQEKIVDAIWKATQSVGGKDRNLAKRLSHEVIELINQKFSSKTPSVEDIQDMTEKVLMEQGNSKIAKSYILYRQKRAEIREEKKRILEKNEIDEVDKNLDINALRVLKSRYLRKDGARTVESAKQLFTRVSTQIGLPDIIFDEKVYAQNGKAPIQQYEEYDFSEFEEKLSIGKYRLNKYHLEALKRLYDRMNNNGCMKMSWSRLMISIKSGDFDTYEKQIDEYYNLMINKKFMPNTPALANFGNPLGMGSACFVMGVEDSIDSIMETLKKAAIIFKAGGGVGYNFSNLRPEGDIVNSTSGLASGPMSFMRMFDMMTDVIKQGGIRRGANMGILNINHPDIEKFINSKKGNEALRNFNISVLVMPDFWDYYENNEPYPLVNPRSGEVVREVNPRMLFDMIVYNAWESGEPGLIFYDHVNKTNPFMKSLGPIVCTNPCGEVLLYPNESCNLGSINVLRFCKADEIGTNYFDWNSLRETIISSVNFLDNIIDINNFPLKEIQDMTLATRKIGLGIMGLGDLLYDMNLQYDSDEGRRFMEKLMEFVSYYSKVASIERAKTRGTFPYFEKSFYTENKLPFTGSDDYVNCHFNWDEIRTTIKKHGIRNAYTTVLAPTGSISMIAGCSSGIEPVYSLVFEKNVKVGNFYYVDQVFEKVMLSEGLYDSDLIRDIINNNGSAQNISYVPSSIKKVFVTALDISPENHIKALACLQKWVDSSISKTNNFPADASVEFMRESYLLAHKLGCKDITVFRDTSIKDQVLVARIRKENKENKEIHTKNYESVAYSQPKKEVMQHRVINNPPTISVSNTFHRGYDSNVRYQALGKGNEESCPMCDNKIFFTEGCVSCPECGWGLCS